MRRAIEMKARIIVTHEAGNISEGDLKVTNPNSRGGIYVLLPNWKDILDGE
jgi:hypothetical protein